VNSIPLFFLLLFVFCLFVRVGMHTTAPFSERDQRTIEANRLFAQYGSAVPATSSYLSRLMGEAPEKRRRLTVDVDPALDLCSADSKTGMAFDLDDARVLSSSEQKRLKYKFLCSLNTESMDILDTTLNHRQQKQFRSGAASGSGASSGGAGQDDATSKYHAALAESLHLTELQPR
jgi:hypothetical protein